MNIKKITVGFRRNIKNGTEEYNNQRMIMNAYSTICDKNK